MQIGSSAAHLDLATRDGELVATIRSHGLSARRRVGPHYADDGFGDLVDYLADLAANWRGWSGGMAWTSLDGDLTLLAHHTGSHVVLLATLQNDDPSRSTRHGTWSASAHLVLDAGEELARASADAREELANAQV
ncbi:DUF6228 family protein [Cellulomonas sp. PhB150]|uniref:DUF6228 family protein n=1 Tax=Cellulomonas sp. PhB150 TaxID=2485188 RepID=UPI000F4A540C|nr:DUF6228 family protein [Cellulomonas sp. PhB150]ROS30903.1 hypothetical protein EDF34_0547 [Cellulomonas sp. PhB150]